MLYRMVKVAGWKEIVAAVVSGLMVGLLMSLLAGIVMVSFPAVFRLVVDASDWSRSSLSRG